ncbi:glycosyltransferase family 4 protein [Planctomycetes bacterium TBK1r]|uniref:D-inositol-3-phosphate glycosyltransferase n=1 Tax=Stieleria magnilauensis TaxID=2527963 RepID=A0ABX5XVD7_9BACT|nr:D-inositol-3-phosphate glycosyltransferase [Planctomycetes bacterium TBK1r]
MKPTILETSTPWFGGHTGYECLRLWISQISDVTVVKPKRNLVSRLKGKWLSLRRGFGNAPQQHVAAIYNFSQRVKRSAGVGHIIYGEEFLPYADILSDEVLSRTLFTFHQPLCQWNKQQLERLGSIEHALFLYDRDKQAFRSYLRSPPSFILHGVDTDFFCPGQYDEPKRLLYNGIHLRNVEMFYRVVAALQKNFPSLCFDALVPEHRRDLPLFRQLANNPRISWHSGLSDSELRDLYQRSYLTLTPMNDSGANTAIVEALASGLPIVTTDVGGIQNYGGGTIFPIVQNNDDDAMVELVTKYLKAPEYRQSVSVKSRAFSVEKLSWSCVAVEHLRLYQSIASSCT